MGSLRPKPSIFDVLIIGGSHAGLSAALTLYRAMHTCVIFDSKEPRDSYDTPVRLSPTWENEETAKYKASSREELLRTGYCTFVDVRVEKIEKSDSELFQAIDSNGKSWFGRKVLIATGEKDVFPDLEGYDKLYAKRM